MKRIEFKPPPGLSVPEGMGAGDTFDLLSTYRIKPNGDICLVAIGDVQMPGYNDKKVDHNDGAKEAGMAAAMKYKEKMNAPMGGSESMGGVGAGAGAY